MSCRWVSPLSGQLNRTRTYAWAKEVVKRFRSRKRLAGIHFPLDLNLIASAFANANAVLSYKNWAIVG